MAHFEDNELRQYGNLEKIQQYQANQINQRLRVTHSEVKSLKQRQQSQSDELDALIAQAESMLAEPDNMNMVGDDEATSMLSEIMSDANAQDTIKDASDKLFPLQTIELTDDWDDFESNLFDYANKQKIELSSDPLTELISLEQRAQIIANIKADFGYRKAHCDKYDYMMATSSGLITGIMDVLLVGSATETKSGSKQHRRLPKVTDAWFNQVILKYSQLDYHLRQISGKHIEKFPKKSPETIEQGVHYLEMQYKVPYDAQYDKRLKGLGPGEMHMSAGNHHLFSLAHYPDFVGLFFSILDQFLNTGSYLSNGRILQATMENDQFKLQGSNFIAKVFSGFVNWLGHLASDTVGSSGAVHKGNRGSGLPVPGTEIFQMLNFNLPGTDNLTLAKITTKVFEQGYDARYAAAASIPVIINELLTRLLWALKQYFYHHKTVSEIVKARNVPEVNRMLLCSYGVFATLDIGDAMTHGLKEGHGNYQKTLVGIFGHLNVALYPRLALQGYKEVVSWYSNNHYNVEEFDHYLGDEWEKLLRN